MHNKSHTRAVFVNSEDELEISIKTLTGQNTVKYSIEKLLILHALRDYVKGRQVANHEPIKLNI